MNKFIASLQFITILPIGKKNIYDPKGMIQFFPLVGIILGLMLAGLDLVFLKFWPAPIAALLDVIFLIIITGAFHLDGLGDSADGLLGHRPLKKVLLIMKDSRIGVMALVVILSSLAIKWGGILSLEPGLNRSLFLIIIPSYARAGMLFGIKFLEYGRPEGGTGHDLFQEELKPSSFWGLLLPMIISIPLGLRGLYLFALFMLFNAIILFFYKRRMNCITGDMLGAMCELLEALLFLFISITIQSWN